MRLKQKDIRVMRDKLCFQQNNICPLCGNHIPSGVGVLDHDHETGKIRGVLHRQCNQVEGRILSWIKRSGQGVPAEQFVSALWRYWSTVYPDVYHPSHLTETEKEIKACNKKIRSLKTERGKQKYRDLLKKLTETEKEKEI